MQEIKCVSRGGTLFHNEGDALDFLSWADRPLNARGQTEEHREVKDVFMTLPRGIHPNLNALHPKTDYRRSLNWTAVYL